MKNKIKGVNILICGSQHFEDEYFVNQTLETFFHQTHGNIRKLFTSRFSGACEFAQKWVNNKNDSLPSEGRISVSNFTFDGFLEKKNSSLYEQLDIPEYAVKNDKFFQEGKDLMIAKGVNLVLAFPNKDGILGASTRNISRFAMLAEIKTFDCSILFEMINSHRKVQEEQATQEVSAQVNEVKNQLGFNNRHPSKF
ncbi:hypothetical protein GW796_09845 [archaeon]|nr:hypothetical protein [archaeon]